MSEPKSETQTIKEIVNAACQRFVRESVQLGPLITEAIEKALTARDREVEELKNGWPHEQPLGDMPLDRQIVMLNRQVESLTKQLEEVRGALLLAKPLCADSSFVTRAKNAALKSK